MFLMGVDLGQAQDFTAISILERIAGTGGERPSYQLRYLHRPALGTPYPVIVQTVLGLLDRAPLDRAVPLVVDKTGVGAAVVDLFTAAGVRPHAVTITAGSEANQEDCYNLKVPKRELASVLVALYQSHRLKVAESLELAGTLIAELANFKVKVNIATGNESYEAWRESVHDDLVLSVALAAWYGEHGRRGGFYYPDKMEEQEQRTPHEEPPVLVQSPTGQQVNLYELGWEREPEW